MPFGGCGSDPSQPATPRLRAARPPAKRLSLRFQGAPPARRARPGARANGSRVGDAKCWRGMREEGRAWTPGPQRGTGGGRFAPGATGPASLSMWLPAVTRSPAPR